MQRCRRQKFWVKANFVTAGQPFFIIFLRLSPIVWISAKQSKCPKDWKIGGRSFYSEGNLNLVNKTETSWLVLSLIFSAFHFSILAKSLLRTSPFLYPMELPFVSFLSFFFSNERFDNWELYPINVKFPALWTNSFCISFAFSSFPSAIVLIHSLGILSHSGNMCSIVQINFPFSSLSQRFSLCSLVKWSSSRLLNKNLQTSGLSS